MSFKKNNNKTVSFRQTTSAASNDAADLPSVSFSKSESSLKYSESTRILTSEEHQLTLRQKLCYAAGGLPFQMCSNALALYMPSFLLEIAQIRPLQVSLISFVSKGWDALSDPIVGYFVSKTNTRFGKLRPWILFSAPFAVIAYMMLWYLPDLSRNSKTYWYIGFYCVFMSALSCLHVPFTSLTMYITPTQSQRDSATSFRMFFEVTGVLLAAVIQGLIISVYNSQTSCDSSTTSLAPTTTSDSSLSSNYTSNSPTDTTTSASADYNKLGEGYLIAAGIMAVIYLICSTTTFFGTKEINDVIKNRDENFGASVLKIFSHKSYLTLLFTFLCNSLAVQFVQTNIALYCKYSVPGKDEYQIILIVLLTTSIISLPIWQLILLKYGKKTTYAWGLMLLIPNLFGLLFVEKAVWLIYIIAGISGLSVAVSFLCPWSMLPDVIDEFALKNRQRNEAIFYSFYVFFTKLATGIAIALSQIVLEYSGYIDCPNGCCQQPKSIDLALRMLIVPGPVILLLLALIFLFFHPINENKRKEIKDKLNALRMETETADEYESKLFD